MTVRIESRVEMLFPFRFGLAQTAGGLLASAGKEEHLIGTFLQISCGQCMCQSIVADRGPSHSPNNFHIFDHEHRPHKR